MIQRLSWGRGLIPIPCAHSAAIRDELYIKKSSQMGLKTGGPVFVHTLHCTYWACLVKGFNTLATAGVLNLPDKRVDPGLGSNPHGGNLVFKPLSGSFQLRTLHCRATLICASFGGLIIYYHFPFSYFPHK